MRSLLAVGAVVALSLATSGFAAQTEKANVVFFLVDDFGWGTLSEMGSKFHETPNIDKLYKNGMHFTNGYAACTVCSPSRAAILTGAYPGRINLTDWIPGHIKRNSKLSVPDWNMKVDHERVTLAEALKEQGYATQFVGKWHLMPTKDRAAMPKHYPTNHGFDINIGGNHWGQPKGKGRYFHPFDMSNPPTSSRTRGRRPFSAWRLVPRPA